MGTQDILLLSHLSAPLHSKQDVSFYACLRRITIRRLRSPNAVVWSTNAVNVICCTTSDVLCCTNAVVRGPNAADVRSPSADVRSPSAADLRTASDSHDNTGASH